jgi:translation initiation factor IF-2
MSGCVAACAPPTTAIPWATARPATTGRCWRRLASSSSGGCLRSSTASRACAIPSRSPTCPVGRGRAAGLRRVGGPVVAHRAPAATRGGHRPPPRPGRVRGRVVGPDADHGVPRRLGRPGGPGPGPGGAGAPPGDRVGGVGRRGQPAHRAAADRGCVCAHGTQRCPADRRGGPCRRPREAAAGGCPGAVGGRGGRADRRVRRSQAPAGGCPCRAGSGRRPARGRRPAAPPLLSLPAVAAVEITPVERPS